MKNLEMITTIVLSISWVATAAAAVDHSKLKFIFIPPETPAYEDVIDLQALNKAADTLSDIFSVIAPVPPERSGLLRDLQRGIHCDPYDKDPLRFVAGNSSFDVSRSLQGEIVVFLHAYTGEDVWKCDRSTLAFSQLCIMEEPHNVPIMAYINVCPENEASMLNQRSTADWRYRIYMHELIHIMGFMEPMIDDVSSKIVGITNLTIAVSPTVVNWARYELFRNLRHHVE